MHFPAEIFKSLNVPTLLLVCPMFVQFANLVFHRFGTLSGLFGEIVHSSSVQILNCDVQMMQSLHRLLAVRLLVKTLRLWCAVLECLLELFLPWRFVNSVVLMLDLLLWRRVEGFDVL